MTRNEIILEVSRDTRYLRYCKRLSVNNGEDLYQDFLLVLLEMEDIQLFYSQVYFIPYCHTVIKNLFLTGVKISIIQFVESLPEAPESKPEITDEKATMTACIKNELLSLPEFDGMMFESYLKAGSTRKLAKQTGIPRNTIAEKVKEVKVKIKKTCKECLER